VAFLLYAHGDVKNPLPETVRVLDEILTDFIQSISFEATRGANYAGRQKVKFEDFEFAFRKNPDFLGKVQEVFEKKGEIDLARKIFKESEEDVMKDAAENNRKDKGATARPEEELGEGDDDAEAELDVGRKK
jgi:transcription initiation factor TFIID subunit 13